MHTVIWTFLALNFIQVSVYCLTADEIEAERSGWNLTPNTQYHIQTDEGPERFFRFQTLNGQYRKEKRLADGTVIGTEGWLDPLGYLRIKDYIADQQGFRILKSKMVFVGKERPIQDAVSISKKVPPQSGILVRPRRPPNPFRQPEIKDVSGNSIEVNTVSPLRSYSPSTLSPAVSVLQYDHPVPTTFRPKVYPFTTPSPYDDGFNANSNYLSTGHQIQNPFINPYERSYSYRVPQPAVIVESPNFNDDQLQAASHVRVAPTGFRGYRLANNTVNSKRYSRYRPEIARRGSVRYQEYPAYDGHHQTADGFQYYLKTHYHEEEQKPNDKTVGSFGYVDPFGIRRVVYYKADPQNGFVHKKNNRYVGFNSKPYDPVSTGSH
ncbi:uncharacterized protein LOC122507775 isoform X2 [Leptopilina heterotoma]|uniref:uncharacterized protein LOC122507775 isoform X2 n=1 Tax=Leptopilina heterotoma TaxID=63436 RepID=UPI001CA98C10|nr:uncharacterized protein LOC122507775 isoform X2 [Leptopilina heterotoma]